MHSRQLRTLAMALAVVGVAVLGNPRTVTADILVTITDGTGASATSETLYSTSNAGAAFFSETIGHYDISLQTVVTSYPGTLAGGSISTNVNILSTTGTGTLEKLTVQVQLVNYNSSSPGSSTNLLWSGPTGNPLSVSAGTSFTPQNATSGTVTTSTYFNSTTDTTTTGVGASTVSASSNVVAGSTSGSNYVQTPNAAGSYTLGQTLTLSGLNAGASANYGGTSMVAAPEPSSLAIAGLGGLGLIGYGLRRRKAPGA
jgi:hypothetical protein